MIPESAALLLFAVWIVTVVYFFYSNRHKFGEDDEKEI